MPIIKIEIMANWLLTLKSARSTAKPFGLSMLERSAKEIKTIKATKIKYTQVVTFKNGIGFPPIKVCKFLNNTTSGMEATAATIAAVEVVRFQNKPKENKANAPGVR